MAQVDKLNYLPLLFWFIVLFLAIYLTCLKRFLPMLYAILKIRRLYYFFVFKRVRKYSRTLYFTHYILTKFVYLLLKYKAAYNVLNTRHAALVGSA